MLKKKSVQIATAHADKEVFIAEICFHIYYSILGFWGHGFLIVLK